MAIIKEIEINRFKRFLSLDSQKVKVTFSEALQLVIGSNGSGKSSILTLLTGMPPDKNDFEDGGGFKIRYEIDGKKIVVAYKRAAKVLKCFFALDDEVLNDWATTTVQKELLQTHLRMDKDIHDLIIGETTFTRMSATKRREWFTRLASVDMSFLINTFNQSKKCSRDNKGALSNTETRLAVTQSKLKGLEIDGDLGKRVQSLTERLNELLIEVNRSVPTTDELFVTVDRHKTEIEQISNRILKGVSARPKVELRESIVDGTTLLHALSDIQVKQAAITAESNVIEQELYELRSVNGQMDELGDVDIESLQRHKTQLDDEIQMLKSSIRHFNLSDAGFDVCSDTDSLESALPAFLSNVPDNVKPSYDSVTAKAKIERRTEVNFRLSRTVDRIDFVKNRIKDVDCDKTVCPKCRFVDYKAHGENAKAKLEAELKELEQSKITLTEELKALDIVAEEWSLYVATGKDFSRLMANYPRCTELWSKIKDSGFLGTTPSSIINIFNQWTQEIAVVRDILHKERDVLTMQDTLAKAKVLGDKNTTFLKEKLAEDEAKLKVLHDRSLKLEQEHRELMSIQSIYLKQVDDIELLERHTKALQQLEREVLESTYQSYLKEAITGLQGELAKLNSLLNQNDLLQGIIEDLRNSKAELELESKLWNILVKALSPEKGLIAKQINADIGLFVNHMNKIISSIWTYDLTIGTCSIDEGELDYKFPVSIPSMNKESADVKYTSKAQGHVIDFVFKCVALEKLSLSGFPMILDELGSSFDEEHRTNLMQLLNTLLETGKVNQLFIVNHYNSMYGSLANAEVLVLDSSNISVPDNFNSHATFK